MKIINIASKLMRMDDEVWFRHSNPWSVWTRVPILLILAPAAYSYHYLGLSSLYIILPLVFWTYLNPRFFKKPDSTKSWSSKAVLGERALTQREKLKIEIPKHHLRMAKTLIYLSSFFGGLLLYGLVFAKAQFVVTGTIGAYLSKMWFLDRMVWLVSDLELTDETVANWIY